MVLNVSEETYDYRRFEDNVLEFKFPGHPAPPLGMLVKICTTLESWLDADHENVVAVHCLTGRGRTSVVVACALAWLGEFEANPVVALRHVAERRKDDVERLTIPSQRRYVGYFANVLDGCAPRGEPLLLRRCIMHTIPNFGTTDKPGCRPYFQFFRSGKLAHTARWEGSQDDKSWAAPSEGSLVFPVDCVVHGDLLVRCRHVDDRERRTSMFRAALHVGFAPTGVLRLTRDQLDGACGDDRFDGDFFVDLIFEACSGSAQALETGVSNEEGGFSAAYDALLAKDSAFWKDVEDRKRRAQQRRASRPARTANARAAEAAAAAPEPLRRAPSPRTKKQDGPVFAIGDDTPSRPKTQTTPDLLDTDDLVRQLADADALFGTEETPSLLELQQLADAPPMSDDFAAFASTPVAAPAAAPPPAPAARTAGAGARACNDDAVEGPVRRLRGDRRAAAGTAAAAAAEPRPARHDGHPRRPRGGARRRAGVCCAGARGRGLRRRRLRVVPRRVGMVGKLGACGPGAFSYPRSSPRPASPRGPPLLLLRGDITR